MSMQDYEKAYKLGKKEYQRRLMEGKRPTLKVLDEILPSKGSYSEVPLGLVQIPLDQIVGTKTDARSNAFARNFMPILKEGSEFALKWARLCDAQVEEGIREPIKAYEYMNKFYVVEGNKRVSVLKYFEVDMIAGKNILIIDDICSKGGTFYHSAKRLKEAGAANIYLYVTHCENTIYEGELLKEDSLIKHIFTTNSLLTAPNEKITIVE